MIPFSYTGIGSVPFRSFEESLPSLELFFNEGGIPFWPQLPKRSPLENMYAQFLEGYPGGFVKNGDVYVDPDLFEKEIETFYERFMSGDLERFRISEERAEGFHKMLNFVEKEGIKPPAFKIQVTGPISFGLVLKEATTGRQIIYSEKYFEPLVHLINRKILWQIEKIKHILPDSEILIFLDEPYMMSWGSAFFSFSEEKVLQAFKESLEGVKGVKGVHCCGNTDWGLLLKAHFNLISFDAYEYFNSFILYRDRIEEFLDKDGILSWGIVPTNEAIKHENPEHLADLMVKNLEKLGGLREKAEKLSMITPSCGTGSMEVEEAKKVFKTLVELSKILRERT